MSQPTAEDIVRRATAAFNAGQPRRGAQAVRARAWPRARRSHAQPSAGRRAVFARRDRSPRAAMSRPASQNGPTMPPRICSPARIARAAGDFDAALSHLDRAIAIAPQREAFLEKARTLDQARSSGRLRPQAREAWRAILKVVPQTSGGRGAARAAGVGGWRPRACGVAARTRGGRRCPRVGLVRSRPRPPGFARL